MSKYVDESGHEWEYVYDSGHRLKTMSDPDDNTILYEYETTFNKPIRVVDQVGMVTTFAYDSGTGLLMTKTVDDGFGTYNYQTTYEYETIGGSMGNLFTKVTQPENESFVDTSELTVRGKTTADAVVTVTVTNTDPVNVVGAEVDADGGFSATVTLEEGPNLIEVYASDYEGREASEFLNVNYVIQQ